MFLIDQNSKDEVQNKNNSQNFSLTQFNNKKKVIKILEKQYADFEEPPQKRQKLSEEDESTQKIPKKLIIKAKFSKNEEEKT